MKRTLGISTLVAGAALVLSACGTSGVENTAATSGSTCTAPAGPIAYVVGGRSNSPAIGGASTPQLLVASTEQAAATQAHVAVLDTGGSPQLSSADLTLTANNGPAREEEQRTNVTKVQNAIMAAAATAPEADPLTALSLAADDLRGHGGAGSIVMVDSGLATTGALDYTKTGMLQAEPTDLAESLAATGQLPDLTGMTVFLVGVGSTAAPQEALDTASRRTLQDQWRAIAEAAGAACVSVDPTPITDPGKAGLPAVSTVEVPEVSPVIPTPGKPSELSLPFQSNSDQFVDPQAAQSALQPLADWLKQTGTSVMLTGTSASDGDEAGRLQISQMRADAVKAALVAQGADASRIQTEGVGTHHPTHVTDLDSSGNLLPGPAAQNRLVVVSIQG